MNDVCMREQKSHVQVETGTSTCKPSRRSNGAALVKRSYNGVTGVFYFPGVATSSAGRSREMNAWIHVCITRRDERQEVAL